MNANTGNSPRFDAVIFDMDGLLIDSERKILQAWLAAANQHGCALTEADYLPVIGLSVRQSNEILTALFDSPAQYKLVRQTAVDLLYDGADEISYPVKPEAPAFVSAVAQRSVPCAVASSSPVGEVQRRMQAVNLIDHMQTIAGGDEVDNGKPDPAVYLLAAQRLQIDPARCLAFEDSENGVRAALAAGMGVVIIPDLIQPSQNLTDQACYRAKGLADCHNQLDQWF